EQTLPFSPLKPLDIDQKTGTFWLRFTIGALSEGNKPVEWLLSLGESLPGDPTLYIPEIQPQTGMTQWESQEITDRHIFKMPEASSEPKTCYIRIAGPPGLWFAPMLRSPHNAANNWGSLARPACVLGLFVIMLLCLLRSFSEHGQWRLWTAFFVAGALTAGYLGLPSMENGHITFSHFASALAPGFTLMLLPHVARHLMRSGSYSRLIDAQLILLTLIGATVTLLPLVPGLSWTARFLEIWPLATIFFIPTALWALFLGLPGSQRFMLVCIIPPLFTAVGILGLLSGFPADVLAACPLAGVALSALMLVAAPNPPIPEQKKGKKDPNLILHDDFDDPNLKINIPQTKSEEKNDLELPNLELPKTKTSHELPSIELPTFTDHSPQEKEPEPKTSEENFNNIEDEIVKLVEKNSEDIVEPSSSPLTAQLLASKEEDFDIEVLMRDIYDKVHTNKENSIQAIGWYMPPNLPLFYRGSSYLKTILYELVASSARALTHGFLHFTVQHYPKDSDPGHLLFTVTDTESVPEKHSFTAIKKAWELATILNGTFSLEGTTHGCVLKMSVHLTHLEEEKPLPQPLIIVCSEDSVTRYTIHKMLKNVPARIFDARNLMAAQVLQQGDHAVLIIAHDAIATPDAAPILADIKKAAQNKKVPCTRTLAITKTDKDWQALGMAGFTYALVEPIDADVLTSTALKVIQEYQDEYQALSAQEAEKNLPNFFGEQAVPNKLGSLLGMGENIAGFIQKEKAEYAQFESQNAQTLHKSQTNKTTIANNLNSTSLPEPHASISKNNHFETSQNKEEAVPEPTKLNDGNKPVHHELPELEIQPNEHLTENIAYNDDWVDDWVGEPIPVIKNCSKKDPSEIEVDENSEQM
ncbi:MAG: hypothetical protein IK079_01595, partial [Desulfovibrio sp.]|nr:hypothetical protein [Desulfovibrio sp.]